MLTEVQEGWNYFHSKIGLCMLRLFSFKTVTDLQTEEHKRQSWVFAVSTNAKAPSNEGCRSQIQRKPNQVWFLHVAGSRCVTFSKRHAGYSNFTWIQGDTAQSSGWEIKSFYIAETETTQKIPAAKNSCSVGQPVGPTIHTCPLPAFPRSAPWKPCWRQTLGSVGIWCDPLWLSIF